MEYQKALQEARFGIKILERHTQRLDLTGCIRRKENNIEKIELLSIKKGFVIDTALNTLKKQKIIKIDKFGCHCVEFTHKFIAIPVKITFCLVDNWGIIQMILTGEDEFKKRMKRIIKHAELTIGNDSANPTQPTDYIRDMMGSVIPVKEEEQLFDLLGEKYVEPENRLNRKPCDANFVIEN